MFITKFAGQIECVQIYSGSNLYAKYNIHFGQDWTLLHGHTEGITQISQPKGGVGVWNFPIDCSFKSTNAHGWPQLIVTVYGTDFLGRDIVRGYGSIHLPMIHGRSLLYIDLFAPMPSSGLTSLLGFIVGRPPEFLDPKLVTKSDGRQVTRVESDGCVKCVVDCTQKDFDKYFD
eukprot:Partr_v1_DN23368_c0_g1_i3_m18253 putative B9 protein domain 1